MNRRLSVIVFLLGFSAAAADAQRKLPRAWPPPHPHRQPHAQKVFMARPNVLTVNFGVGAIAGYFSGSAGLEYERFLDKKGAFSISLPLAVYAGGALSLGEFGRGDTRTKTSGFYTAPGVRYHPFGNTRQADLGVGAAVAFGIHNRLDRYMDNATRITETEYHEPLVAMLAQVNLNIHMDGGFMLGFQLSGGPTLSSGATQGGFVQFGLKIGGGL